MYSSMTLVKDAGDPYDTLILEKLRGLYSSCMNEDLLDARGAEPLLRVVQTVRKLYNGQTTVIGESQESTSDTKALEDDEDKERKGLSAAIAYLHSRG